MENPTTLLLASNITKRDGFRSHFMRTAPRAHPMYIASGESSNINPWWAAIAVPVIMFLGAVLKTWSEMWQGRDNSLTKWRTDIIAWNERQEARIVQLENNVQGEQVLRHEIKGQLHKEQLAHELLKAEYAHAKGECEQHRKELEALKVEHAALKVAYEKQCAGNHESATPTREIA
jgi:hypothetical protein